MHVADVADVQWCEGQPTTRLTAQDEDGSPCVMPSANAIRPVEQRHELRLVEMRDEQQGFVGMMPVGTRVASAANLVAGGGQHEAQRGLERGHVEWTAPTKFGPKLRPVTNFLVARNGNRLIALAKTHSGPAFRRRIRIWTRIGPVRASWCRFGDC